MDTSFFYVQMMTFKSKIISLVTKYIISNVVTPTKKVIKIFVRSLSEQVSVTENVIA